MQYDREKLKAVVLYTCAKCKSDDLGAVKLQKVLYFSDTLSYTCDGRPITGSTYRKRQHGPTCEQLRGVLKELENAREIFVEDVEYFGYVKKNFTALVEPDLARLNGVELAILDEVIEFVCKNNTAKTISELSHNQAWDSVEFGEVIPYTSAFRMFPTQLSDDDLAWAAEQEAIIERRKRKEEMGLKPFRTLRARFSEGLWDAP